MPGRTTRRAECLYPMYTGMQPSDSPETLEECGRGHAAAAARSTAAPNRRCGPLPEKPAPRKPELCGSSTNARLFCADLREHPENPEKLFNAAVAGIHLGDPVRLSFGQRSAGWRILQGRIRKYPLWRLPPLPASSPPEATGPLYPDAGACPFASAFNAASSSDVS